MAIGHPEPAFAGPGGHTALPAGEGASDGQLLQRFAAGHDEAAFAALVERHGPMVLAVCRRALNDWHDAADAFQATFLVLVRKAGTLSRPELLGNWLYRVAYRTAVKAKARAALRRAHERQAACMPTAGPTAERGGREPHEDLDEALNRLPEKHRAPLVLCYLEGKTNAEAARLLGWPAGSMSWRLARAREALRERLAPGGAGAVLWPQLPAAVPTELARSTVQAAWLYASGGGLPVGVAGLAEEVLRGMRLTGSRPRWALALLLAALLTSLGAGAWAATGRVSGPAGGQKARVSQPAPDSAPRGACHP
jgi:RNA polymerase sigma factor (sigma-70 family)